MGYSLDVKRSPFFNELPESERKWAFSLTLKKYVSKIDNIYYSVHIDGDGMDSVGHVSRRLAPLFEKLRVFKEQAVKTRQLVLFGGGLYGDLYIDSKSFRAYSLCLSRPDFYDIFFYAPDKELPNDDTPRIIVQLRSCGLWTHDPIDMLAQSYADIDKVLSDIGLEIDRTKENRIDYCYHTNAISSPGSLFTSKGKDSVVSGLVTSLKSGQSVFGLSRRGNGISRNETYIALGSRKGNNCFVRVYDKALEVIEQGYKGFFLGYWLKSKLISNYDYYCYSYAYEHRRMDAVYKARLMYYVDYCAANGIYNALRLEYERALADKAATPVIFEELANRHMPPNTPVINIEFETKRKFYRHSDDFIDGLKTLPHEGVPAALKRLFQVVDNCSVFLDYLTDKVLSFRRENGEYMSFWARLRNTKLSGFKSNARLLREYDRELNEKRIKQNVVSAMASAAVYRGLGKRETDLAYDIADALCNLNDNDVRKLSVMYRVCDGETGEVLDGSSAFGEYDSRYRLMKAKKEVYFKNRLKGDARAKVRKLGRNNKRNSA
jgi:hypothetical protein